MSSTAKTTARGSLLLVVWRTRLGGPVNWIRRR
jgi:hypothetical protein